eukprot:765208-Hanusia_phi.AAC.3
MNSVSLYHSKLSRLPSVSERLAFAAVLGYDPITVPRAAAPAAAGGPAWHPIQRFASAQPRASKLASRLEGYADDPPGRSSRPAMICAALGM